jgi:hypothetical protein
MASGFEGKSFSMLWASWHSETSVLGELGRATTAYHEATPDRLEDARLEYERALNSFRNANSLSFGPEQG